MAYTELDKIELFEQAIMEKAAAEKSEILTQTEEMKRAELDREESRLLEDLYRRIQAQISEIKTNNIKEISRETLATKKKLYQQREHYLVEILARARVELVTFVKSDAYEAFLMQKIALFAAEHPYEGSVIRVRTEDLRYAPQIKAIYGACDVEGDDEELTIGGAILLNRTRGVEVDESLDAALAAQRDWFYNNSNFNFE